MDKVRNDGRFLRIKTFADSVAVPMSNIILKIYEYSANSLLESDIWFDKRRQLEDWSKDFSERANRRFDSLYNELSATLRNEIQNFAEYHYEDERINDTWPAHVKKLGFDTRYQNLLQELAGECERKRKELSDELRQEMSYAFSGKASTNIALTDTTDWGEYGSALLGGIGGVGGFLASRAIGFAFPPLGIALAAVSVLGWLFSDSKAEKIRKAKAKLCKDLTQPSFDMLNNIHNQVAEIYNNEIWNKGIVEFSNLLASYQFMLARLGKSQNDMAWKLFDEFSDLNFRLLGEAIDYTNAGSAKGVTVIPRIPGETMVIFAKHWHLDTRKISDLLGEQTLVMKADEDVAENVRNILGSEFDIDSYPLDFSKENEEPEYVYAAFPKNKVTATNFKIAQQIAGAPIITNVSAPSNRQSQPIQCEQKITQHTEQIDFDARFKVVADMLDKNLHSSIIKNELFEIEYQAKNLRNAEAMRQLSHYWLSVGQDKQAARCSDYAKQYAR